MKSLFYIVILPFLVCASCTSKMEEALLHPAPNPGSKENLTLDIDYLVKVTNEANNSETLGKALQLLKNSDWPEGHEEQIKKLSGDLDAKDSTILSNLVTFYKINDNAYMMRLYANKAEKLGFSSSETLYALASGYLQESQLDSALSFINKAIKKKALTDYFLLKGQIYQSKKDTSKAISALLMANQETSLDIHFTKDLMRLLVGKNRLTEAADIGSKYLRTDSTSNSVLLLQGKVLNRLNKTEEAISLIKKIPETSAERFKTLIAIYNQHKQYDEIIQETLSLSSQKSLENEVLLARARAYDKKWFLKSAIRTYSLLLQKDTADKVVQREFEKVKGKATYLRRIKELDNNIDNTQ